MNSLDLRIISQFITQQVEIFNLNHLGPHKFISMADWAIDFFNGSLSGIGNCISGYVFDTLKVRMQLEPNLSMMDEFKKIVRNQGFITLFNGMYYPIITVPIVNAIVYGSYEAYKKIMKKDTLSMIDGIQNGAFAGFVNSFVVGPVELVKCVMQNDQDHKFQSSKECLRQIVKEKGIQGLFKGMMATIYREVPAYAGQFACYEELKFLCLKGENRNLSILEGMIVGGLAGISCWIFSYPQDLIKTHLQVEDNVYKENRILKDGGFFECGKEIYRKAGFKGLWRGIQPCLIRAFVANAVGIAIYEKAQQYHKKHPIDSHYSESI